MQKVSQKQIQESGRSSRVVKDYKETKDSKVQHQPRRASRKWTKVNLELTRPILKFFQITNFPKSILA